MNTKLVLAVGIAGVILLVTGTSVISLVKMAFAEPNSNSNAPWRAPGLNDPHRNPSGDFSQPGQVGSHGSPGACQKATGDHDTCHATN